MQTYVDGTPLRGFIQLNNATGTLGHNVRVLSGTVYDQYIRTMTDVAQDGTDEHGNPIYVVTNSPVTDMKICNFWILNNGTIAVNRKDCRGIVANMIKNAIGTDITPVRINILDVAEDYPNNWIGGIVDREGHWQKGTLWGDDLREDDCVGEEFTRCTKKQVGGYAEFFGGSIKFKVTTDGVVAVYRDFPNERDDYLRFVLNEIREYFV
jgi:hypothetical protein